MITGFFEKTLGGVCDTQKAPGFGSLPENELEHQKQWQKSVTGWWNNLSDWVYRWTGGAYW